MHLFCYDRTRTFHRTHIDITTHTHTHHIKVVTVHTSCSMQTMMMATTDADDTPKNGRTILRITRTILRIMVHFIVAANIHTHTFIICYVRSTSTRCDGRKPRARAPNTSARQSGIWIIKSQQQHQQMPQKTHNAGRKMRPLHSAHRARTLHQYDDGPGIQQIA